MFIYPWGDMHSLNLGWFLMQFKEWINKIEEYLDNGGGTSENLANVIAPVFNAANYYSAGDYVLYNDELFKANQAINPGTWDPDEWTRCLVTEEMGSGGTGVDNVARLMIAGQYSATYNYQKYAICRYADKLWMCNTNLPTGGEEWEPSHWDEITVGAGLTGLRRSVESLSDGIDALNVAIKSYLFLGTGTDAPLIENGTDYNNLTSIGVYRVLTSVDAATMINTPNTKIAHRLIVMYLLNSSSIVQILIANYETNPAIFSRVKTTGGNWSPWRLLAPIRNAVITVSPGTGTQTFSWNICSQYAQVSNVYYSNPKAVGSDITFTTGDGTISITGTFYESTDINFDVQ